MDESRRAHVLEADTTPQGRVLHDQNLGSNCVGG